jgi:hypothetical protein
LAQAAGITAGSWYASPATHVGYKLISAGMLIVAGDGRCLPMDYDELERWRGWDTSEVAQCCAGTVKAASVRMVSRQVTSVRQAAAACNVTPPVVRRWLSLGLITPPPWTLQQLHQVRKLTDPDGRRLGPQAAHGTLTRWLEGCDCDRCSTAQNDAAKARFRRRAQARLPIEVRKQFLDAIYAGKPFKAAIRDFGLTSNQVWGLTKTD